MVVRFWFTIRMASFLESGIFDAMATCREILDPIQIGVLLDLEQESSPGLVKDLASTFLREAPLRVEALLASVADGNKERVRREAHLLAGGAAILGAHALRNLAEELEAFGNSKPSRDPSLTVTLLSTESKLVFSALDQLVQRKGI